VRGSERDGGAPELVVVSASRRTDLPNFHLEYLEAALESGRAAVQGHYGNSYAVDLTPESVHTIVFWSKDYHRFLAPKARICSLLRRYSHLHFHLTITGLSQPDVEPGSPPFRDAIAQLPRLAELAGSPDRVTVRFDPVVFWTGGGTVHSNHPLFEDIAALVARHEVRRLVTSFAQWYGKSIRRARARGFPFVDPPSDEKASIAREMAQAAARAGACLSICAQKDIAEASGVPLSSCIDGALLSSLHPRHLVADLRKDPGQRPDCLCTRSKDIGSYSQVCPSRCVYCYASTAA